MSPGLSGPLFRLDSQDLEAGFHEIRVEGELDLSVADRLRERLLAAQERPVLVDLSGCTFIDSTGIAVVLLARRDGQAIAVHSPSDQVLRVLAVTGLTGDGVVFGDRREAMAGLAAPAEGGQSSPAGGASPASRGSS